MIDYKGKRYENIIWDWRSTLYDPFTENLYPWVGIFFKKYKLNNYLVSWAANPSKRTELINSFPLMKNFKRIIVTGENKKDVFESIFDLKELDPELTLVVGDNMNDEIALAKELGIDSEEVSKFIKNMGLAK